MVIRSQKTAFKYDRSVQPAARQGEWVAVLSEILAQEARVGFRSRSSGGRGSMKPTLGRVGELSNHAPRSERGIGPNPRFEVGRLFSNRPLW